MVRLSDGLCPIDFEERTRAYYARWLGRTEFPAENAVIYDAARNKPPYGYADYFDIYALRLRAGGQYVAYGDRAKAGIDRIDPNESLPEALEAAYGKRPTHHIKYALCTLPAGKTRARVLSASDFPAWRAFFLALFPGDDSWLQGYYDDMTATGMACGVFEDDKLACATDLPDMPHMAQSVREIGVNTLPAYRRKGDARDACVSTVRAMLNKRICPLWSTGADNTASRRCAEAVGFQEFADVYTISL